MAAAAASASASPRIGRPRKVVTSRWMQLQGAEQPARAPTYAATLKLPTRILQRLQAGEAAHIDVGAKKITLVVGADHFILRREHEDAHKVDAFESTLYDDISSAAGAAASPLFAPYDNVLRPLTHARLEHRLFVPDEEKKKLIKQRNALVDEQGRAPRVMHTTDAIVPVSAAELAEAKQDRKRKRAQPAAAVTGAASADVPKAKRAYTKRAKPAAAPTVAEAAVVSAAPMVASSVIAATSPATLPAVAPAVVSTPLQTPAAPAAALVQPSTSLLSSSFAAVPLAAIAAEPLRARLIHFLAAQPNGISSSALVSRLGVPLVELKSLLSTVAVYEAPGVYRLRPQMLAEVRLDWAGYTEEDRARLKDMMLQAGTPMTQRERSADAAAAGTSESLQVLPLPALPPLPDATELADCVSASLPDSGVAREIKSYLDYARLHTECLQKMRVYVQLRAWIDAVQSALEQLQAQAAAAAESNEREARDRQTSTFQQQHAQALAACRQQRAALHATLVPLRSSVVAYASDPAHSHYIAPLLREELS